MISVNVKKYKILLGVLVAILALTVMSPARFAAAERNPDPGVIPPGAEPYGESYGEWNSAWVRWVLSIPINDSSHPEVHPLLDPTGASCSARQSGHVWFLAGSLIGPVTRNNCTIPAGKALFFPIVNAWCDSSPVSCGSTYDQLLAAIKPAIDGATNLQVAVDGRTIRDIPRYRATTPRPNPFYFNLPDHNLYQYFGNPDAVAGRYYGVADGYYLMLAPLNVGTHTIHLHGDLPGGGPSQDVTYNLRVVPSR
jgi:hypothetical protein